MCGGSGGCGSVVSMVLPIAAAVVAPELAPIFLSDAIGSTAAVGLTGAALGGLSSAVTGGNPLMGALTGGIGGALSGSGAMSGLFDGTSGDLGPAMADAPNVTAGDPSAPAFVPDAGGGAGYEPGYSGTAGNTLDSATGNGLNSLASSSLTEGDQALRQQALNRALDQASGQGYGNGPSVSGITESTDITKGPPGSYGPETFQSSALKGADSSGGIGAKALEFAKKNPLLVAGLGLSALTAMSGQNQPKTLDYRLPSSQMGSGIGSQINNLGPLNRQYSGTDPSRAGFRPEHNYFTNNPGFTPLQFAAGGRTYKDTRSFANNINQRGRPAIPRQIKLDRGGQVRGPGDGMSDNVPAMIDNVQPAKLSQDEFVIPADVVAAAGNGSSNAGHKNFYNLISNIRQKAHGSMKQQKRIKTPLMDMLK